MIDPTDPHTDDLLAPQLPLTGGSNAPATPRAFPGVPMDPDRAANAVRRICDDYADACAKLGAHQWGQLTVEDARAALEFFRQERTALRAALRALLAQAEYLSDTHQGVMDHPDVIAARAALEPRP